MLTFPLPEGVMLLILEPGNIARLKEGRPLKVGEHIVCFTPDMQEFVNRLGVPLDVDSVKIGDPARREVKLTPEKIQAALDACQNLPEVLR